MPEVETVRQALLPRLVGRAFTHVTILPNNPKLVRQPSAAEFCRDLVGRRIEDVSRRGKYLLLPLSHGLTLIVHLRMTGALLHRQPDDSPDPYTRAIFDLDDGTQLRYRDPRKLGNMWLLADPAQVVGELGPDAMSEALTPAELYQRLERRAAPIKSALLNQEVVAGLGNIYADEALFLAGLRPTRPAKSLTPDEAERLHRAIAQALTKGMNYRGSSFRWFVDAQGQRGEHQHHAMVFRRTGQPCYRCGTPIQRVKLGGRSTHFCPTCQP
ncbi:MAG: bifunctional DNA-formamidopyrimidine glycosylase/DNA-(apurinic or apyrimidinic site) lyase [Dehalococcoidia bacterium]